jgi:hypothetical protein
LGIFGLPAASDLVELEAGFILNAMFPIVWENAVKIKRTRKPRKQLEHIYEPTF